MTKVYLVRYGEYSDQGIAGVFSTEEKAQRYCDIQNKIDNYTDFWVSEYKVDEEEYPEDTKIELYYSVWIATEDDGFVKSGTIYLEDESDEVFTRPVVIEKTGDSILVKSTKSMEHAKKVAIEQYQIYTQQKLENQIAENT